MIGKHICIFGDSIAWGASDHQGGGWAERLRLWVESKNVENVVFNLGVPNDTSTDLLKRFKNEATPRRPDVIIIAIGINDSRYFLKSNTPETSLLKFKVNIVKTIELAKKFTRRVAMIGLTPVDESKTMPRPRARERFYSNKRIELYDQVLSNLSKKARVVYVPLFKIIKSRGDLADGLHPTAKAHEKIFKIISSKLESWLV